MYVCIHNDVAVNDEINPEAGLLKFCNDAICKI